MRLSLDETVWYLYANKKVKINALWLRRQIKKGNIPAIKTSSGAYVIERCIQTLDRIYTLWKTPRSKGGRPKGAKDKTKRNKGG